MAFFGNMLTFNVIIITIIKYAWHAKWGHWFECWPLSHYFTIRRSVRGGGGNTWTTPRQETERTRQQSLDINNQDMDRKKTRYCWTFQSYHVMSYQGYHFGNIKWNIRQRSTTWHMTQPEERPHGACLVFRACMDERVGLHDEMSFVWCMKHMKTYWLVDSHV